MTGHIDNLYALFGRATVRERAESGQAYFRYHRILKEIALATGFPTATAAAVFSALSPNNDYLGNLRDARKMLEAARAGKQIADFSVSTYGHNKRKAWDVVQGMDPLQAIIADKTRNFYLNLAFPDDPEPVTVDGHMFWAWHGRRGRVTGHKVKGDGVPTNRLGAAAMNSRLYQEIADAVRQIAQHHGLLGHQVQSIIWHAYRQQHNILGTQQLELLPSDLIVAGILAA